MLTKVEDVEGCGAHQHQCNGWCLVCIGVMMGVGAGLGGYQVETMGQRALVGRVEQKRVGGEAVR
jgi:hypothetical protein